MKKVSKTRMKNLSIKNSIRNNRTNLISHKKLKEMEAKAAKEEKRKREAEARAAKQAAKETKQEERLSLSTCLGRCSRLASTLSLPLSNTRALASLTIIKQLEKVEIMDKWIVNFDGFITVKANSEEEAYEKANAYLSQSNLVNDGDEGEWYLGEAQL